MTADQIRAELDQLNAAEVSPGLAALALALAETFDDTDAPTSRAVVARELTATMIKLRALSPPAAEGDALDELTDRREERKRKQRGA